MLPDTQTMSKPTSPLRNVSRISRIKPASTPLSTSHADYDNTLKKLDALVPVSQAILIPLSTKMTSTGLPQFISNARKPN